MSKDTEKVISLIEQAEKAFEPMHAMQLSQAALNAANAIRVLADIPADERKE